MQHVQSRSATKPPKHRRGAISLFRDHICEQRKRRLEASEMEEGKRIKIKELNSIQAPIGVSYGPSSVGGKRRSFPSAVACNRDNGELYNSEDLKRSMERVAEAQGIKVTLGCADLLNIALNAHLKRILKFTIELARGRSMHKPTKDPVLRQQFNGRPLNGIWAGNHMKLQNGLESMNVNNVHRNQYMISMQDFQAAMELNPQQLGHNWPSLLERISLHSFKE
ncbi:uncharacterized protein LOC110037651 [Phalaenopsis equestris]|uniref:uncharacterized protein LOC110037651 n=1 Tax=Phalaenopsis equestris TaxID=78828 RepID=UPI0009E27751|nr:uncharacterized protein LOC110037651 [Phalaenopsis equestris]